MSVRLEDVRDRKIATAFSISGRLFERLDRAADAMGMNRSRFAEAAIAARIDEVLKEGPGKTT